MATVPIKRLRRPAASEIRRLIRRDGEPLIVEGMIARWPALSRWSFEWFRDRFGEDRVTVVDSINQPVVKHTTSLGDYLGYVVSPESHPLASLERGGRLYVYGYRPFSSHPELRDDYAPSDLMEDWLASLNEPVRSIFNQGWILFSAVGATTEFHVDFLHTHAWLAQVRGRKDCILVSPSQSECLYGGRANPLRPDYDLHPRFREAKLWSGSLVPGQALLVPSGWWHHVSTTETSLTVSHNVVNGANFGDFVDELCRTLPTVVGALQGRESIRRQLGITWTSRGFEEADGAMSSAEEPPRSPGSSRVG